MKVGRKETMTFPLSFRELLPRELKWYMKEGKCIQDAALHEEHIIIILTQ
jgi:hypothetical protein